MITCNLMGGLGNQMFQIFATISYAIKNKQKFQFLNVDTLGGNGCTQRNTYWKTFFHRLQLFLMNEYPKDVEILREKGFRFHILTNKELLPNKNNKNYLLYGYFQSYKYFQDNYASICKMIGLEEMKMKLFEKLKTINSNNDYLNTLNNLNNCISMHFRIGDYKKIQHKV